MAELNENVAPLMKKGDIMINPMTQRPVRIGSKTWLNLVKQGVCKGQYADDRVVYELQEGDNTEQLKDEMNKKLPRGKQAVKGRGALKGKLVIRNAPLGAEDVTRYTAKRAATVMSEMMQSGDEDLENLGTDELEAKLEALIMAQVMTGTSRKGKTLSNPKAKKAQAVEYYEKKDEEDEEDEEDDDVEDEDDEEDED